MKKFFVFAAILFSTMAVSKAAHAQYYTFGLGPVGNVFAVEGSPDMDPGIGGYLYFDYRWSPQLSTQVSVIITTEDGDGPDNGDKGIEFLGIPTFDIKYYLLTNVSSWDPYIMMGVGFYAVSEGTRSNGTFSVGVGANVGLGVDYYFNDKWSVGLTSSFRSIGLIDSASSSGKGKAIFPVTLTGNVAYHF